MESGSYPHQIGTSCFVTAFRVDPPPAVEPIPRHEWMAVATAHVYDAQQRPQGVPTEELAIMSGVVMQSVHGRGTARSEAGALKVALHALIFQLAARGFIDKQDVDDIAFPPRK
jgi:hypothetical protein